MPPDGTITIMHPYDRLLGTSAVPAPPVMSRLPHALSAEDGEGPAPPRSGVGQRVADSGVRYTSVQRRGLCAPLDASGGDRLPPARRPSGTPVPAVFQCPAAGKGRALLQRDTRDG